MIAEAIDTELALGWALCVWIVLMALVVTLALYAAVTVAWWVGRSVWRACRGAWRGLQATHSPSRDSRTAEPALRASQRRSAPRQTGTPVKPNETLPDGIAKHITIYPVGLLADWQQFVHHPDRKGARRRLRYALRYPLRQARARNWRAAKNYFNGYLAEHATLGTRAGTGWTRGRAYRDLARHLHSDPRINA